MIVWLDIGSSAFGVSAALFWLFQRPARCEAKGK